MRIKRYACVLVSLLFAMSFPISALAKPLGVQSDSYVERVAGSDRYSTAVEVSNHFGFDSKTIIVASGEDFPDALAASGLAGTVKAPLLLTQNKSLPLVTRLEVEASYLLEKIYIIGGTGAVSPEIETYLSKYAPVERLGGNDRYETAYKVASEVTRIKGHQPRVFLARGDDFADALSISATAAHIGAPVLLTQPSKLDKHVARFVDDNTEGLNYHPADSGEEDIWITTEVVIVGGTGAVSPNVADSMRSYAHVTRWAGFDRYETSVAVAKGSASVFVIADHEHTNDSIQYGIASGENFPDGLSGGIALGHANGPLLLTTTRELPAEVADYFREVAPERVSIFGGYGAVSDSVLDQVIELVDP